MLHLVIDMIPRTPTSFLTIQGAAFSVSSSLGLLSDFGSIGPNSETNVSGIAFGGGGWKQFKVWINNARHFS